MDLLDLAYPGLAMLERINKVLIQCVLTFLFKLSGFEEKGKLLFKLFLQVCQEKKKKKRA